MKKLLIPAILFAGILLAGCEKDEAPMTEAQCKQTLCTKDNCYVWSAELNRCGTADALKKEEDRLKKLAKKAEKKADEKAPLPKATRDSLAKLDKKEKAILKDMKALNKTIDSLIAADSASGKPLSAAAYLKAKQEAEKAAITQKYKALMDSVELLNLVNRKPITAVQWVEYNRHKKNVKLEKLERKKDKLLFGPKK